MEVMTYSPRLSGQVHVTASFQNSTSWLVNASTDVSMGDIGTMEATDAVNVIVLSLLFFVIGLLGISGNLLVIIAVVCNKKMRTSMTNLLITNLSVADLVIMGFGIPEVIQFMLNKGWQFDEITCKVNRFILVTALLVSVLNLVSFCVYW
jgi:hypothetical protein